ncbi:hypothetical protein L249_3469 [Ophiocordyceps polyrhachis-furcata BCC 54312]|uniref:Uncharacterized protein n=1 Tax=Ophiocordyceps polyrhachis-furcata BCC 54312 TaxID=1330021 RepID=A0A367LME0_9HYPO|nr:hypothetical protein L249_3469 [Ophiocordyceps polyrhachis-furcata BCC 54312]
MDQRSRRLRPPPFRNPGTATSVLAAQCASLLRPRFVRPPSQPCRSGEAEARGMRPPAEERRARVACAIGRFQATLSGMTFGSRENKMSTGTQTLLDRERVHRHLVCLCQMTALVKDGYLPLMQCHVRMMRNTSAALSSSLSKKEKPPQSDNVAHNQKADHRFFFFFFFEVFNFNATSPVRERPSIDTPPPRRRAGSRAKPTGLVIRRCRNLFG